MSRWQEHGSCGPRIRDMPGSWPPHELPALTDQNCQMSSPATRRYNCIAWAAGNTARKWWPDPMGIGYWPPGVARTETTEAFLRAYGTLGYVLCFDGVLEAGVEKIALYATGPAGAETPTHAALQLETGEWTSKLGDFEDVTHAVPANAEGPRYGRVMCYLARPRRP